MRTDGYSEVKWEKESSGNAMNIKLYDIEGHEVAIDGINLLTDGPSEWSEWMTPKTNVENSTFNIGHMNLGDKNIGDTYTYTANGWVATANYGDGDNTRY